MDRDGMILFYRSWILKEMKFYNNYNRLGSLKIYLKCPMPSKVWGFFYNHTNFNERLDKGVTI